MRCDLCPNPVDQGCDRLRTGHPAAAICRVEVYDGAERLTRALAEWQVSARPRWRLGDAEPQRRHTYDVGVASNFGAGA